MCIVIYVIIVITYVSRMLIQPNEAINEIMICDYYIFEWKSQMKVHIFHLILNGSLNR
jgi:hypothetical protein